MKRLMLIKKVVVGNFQANCYIAGEEKAGRGVIIDPGGDARRVLDIVEENKLEIVYIIATHAHIDHIADLKRVKELTGAQFLLHPGDAPFLEKPELNLSSLLQDPRTFPSPERFIRDEEKLRIGEVEFRIIHTPGHTPGSISLIVDRCAFTGDALFAAGIGRVDLPGGDFKTLQRSIRERIYSLPEETRVFPGHGPETSIKKEKRDNPFVKIER